MSKNNGTAQKTPSLTAAARGAMAPSPAAATDAGSSTTIPIANIRPSPLNPRKTFDESSLADLAESIKGVGVLQPILVRPIQPIPLQPEKRRYELVDGERRFRAARLARLTQIPAIVRALTDREVLEIAVVTCEQREDVSPLEKAEGYRKLIEDHGTPIEELAARVGKSPSTIRGLLKLPQLPPLALGALSLGRLPIETAKLIARVGGEARHNAAVWILANTVPMDGGDLTPGATYERIASQGKDCMSFRDAQELIERHFQVQLKGAPFSRKAIDLVEGATSCEACPKRAGNAPEDFPGLRADVCTDPTCFRAKVEAHCAKLVASSGFPAMAQREAQHTFSPDGQVNIWSGWTDLDEVFPAGKKKPSTYRELIGEQVRRHTFAAIDPKGRLRLLAVTAHVNTALRAAGLLASPAEKYEERSTKSEVKTAEPVAAAADDGPPPAGNDAPPTKPAAKIAPSIVAREAARAAIEQLLPPAIVVEGFDRVAWMRIWDYAERRLTASAEDPDDGNDETEHDLGVGDKAAPAAIKVGSRVTLDRDREAIGTVTATKTQGRQTMYFVEWSPPPGKKTAGKGWCSAGTITAIVAPPESPAVSAETLLKDLANEGGRDPVVGYHETLHQLAGRHVVTAGDLIERARTQGAKEWGTALYGAIRSCPGVSADMAKRVAHQLEDLLRPLWGDPEKATKKVLARINARRCRHCQRTQVDNPDLDFEDDYLCADCAGATEAVG